MIEGLRRYFEKHGDSGGDGDGGAGEMSDGDGSSDDEEGNLTVKITEATRHSSCCFCLCERRQWVL